MIFVRDQRRETLIVAMLTGTRVAFILRISLSRPCLETRGFSLCPVSREKYFKSTYFRDKIPKNFNATNVSSICCLSLKSVAPIWRIVFTEYQLIWRDMLQSTFRYLRNYIDRHHIIYRIFNNLNWIPRRSWSIFKSRAIPSRNVHAILINAARASLPSLAYLQTPDRTGTTVCNNNGLE